MRTSLNEIRENEEYLSGGMRTEDALVHEARMLSNPLLKINFLLQKKTMAILALYHRKKLKEEAERVHRRLFSDPAKAAFQQSVFQCFKK
jgi:hypothetical protein